MALDAENAYFWEIANERVQTKKFLEYPMKSKQKNRALKQLQSK